MKLIEAILDFLYPPRCIVCGDIAIKTKDDKAFCTECRKNIPWIEARHRCRYCSVPHEKDPVCVVCKGREKEYKRAVAVFEYSIVKETIENYKFKGHKYLSDHIGEVMYRYACRFYPELLNVCDIICPVPIHSTRLEERGYDQSVLLAKVISEKSGIEYDKAIVRIRATDPQSLIKGHNLREDNVKGAFKAIKDITGKTVMLIDDVLTTGNSANECTKALLSAGAKEVYVFTFAASFNQSHQSEDSNR